MILSTYSKGIDHVLKRIAKAPDIAVILGSGLGHFATRLQRTVIIDTDTIPGYPTFTVKGHPGRIVVGRIGVINVLTFQGRIHYYEFGNYDGVLFPIILSHQLGVRRLIITNTAGGINRNFSPSDLMLIVDHMNFMGENPIQSFRFPSKRHKHAPYYSPTLISVAKQAAAEIDLPIRSGVYCAVKGPNYETGAEVEMLYRLGADAVGMSTVPEVTLAHQFDIEVLGISLISNMATGITRFRHSHVDVTTVARIAAGNLTVLLERVISKISKH